MTQENKICPRQQAFIDGMTKVIHLYEKSIIKDDDELKIECVLEFSRFVNLWCPTLKEYDDSTT